MAADYPPDTDGDSQAPHELCTCGGYLVYQKIDHLCYKVETATDPRRYQLMLDFLEYCYQHMHFLVQQETLLERVCEQLVTADNLPRDHLHWQRYQLLKYYYAPSFLAGEKLAHQRVAPDTVPLSTQHCHG